VKPKSDLVLDASALLALLKAEPGAERVAEVIDRAVMGAVNLAEVTSKLIWENVPRGQIQEWIGVLELEIRPFDQELAYAAGALLTATRSKGLSLGDRACLALALRLGGTAMTTDRAWAQVDVGVPIELIR
jgi:ribonuclease VapC